ncbi:MAG: hypothetical protein L0Y71_08840 [Gemmataceae bacterium]|nr:hypothetical protein [Gemmataceae bacterium]
MPVLVQIVWLLIAIPYMVAWWATLRILFGRWFQPLEWIPVSILAFGIPFVLLDTFAARGESLGYWLAGAWGAVPAPVLLWRGFRRWRRTTQPPKCP